MEVKEETIEGRTYTVTAYDSGAVVKELKQAPAEVSLRRILTKLEFKRRFTPLELAAYVTALQADTQLQVFENLFNAAGEVNLDDPLTAQGVAYLIATNIIKADREAAIMEGI